MDKQSLKNLKKQLKELEKRLLAKEKYYQEQMDKKIHPDDDLGKARDVFDNIMRQLPQQEAEKDWAEKKEGLWKKMASLLILISE